MSCPFIDVIDMHIFPEYTASGHIISSVDLFD